MVWVPSLRYGQPAVLAQNGVALELAALRQSLALIRFRLRSSAQPDGGGEQKHMRVRGDLTREARHRLPESAFIPPQPVGLGRGAQLKTDQGERVSEPKASSSLTPFSASTAGCL